MSQTACTTDTATSLPSPAERLAADVVIYDGHCGICTAQVARLNRWDSRGRLAFLSLHDPLVARVYPDLSHEALMAAMYVVDPSGRRYAGAAAVRRIARQLPRLWCLYPLLSVPGTMWFWQWGYRQVANRRYRLSQATCPDGACQLHGPDRRA